VAWGIHCLGDVDWECEARGRGVECLLWSGRYVCCGVELGAETEANVFYSSTIMVTTLCDKKKNVDSSHAIRARDKWLFSIQIRCCLSLLVQEYM